MTAVGHGCGDIARVTYRDIVIGDLVDSETELLERIVDLTIERAAYRESTLQAIHALHHVTVERDRLRAQHHRLIDEYRALRVQMLRKAAV